jgi:hypothetical protein
MLASELQGNASPETVGNDIGRAHHVSIKHGQSVANQVIDCVASFRHVTTTMPALVIAQDEPISRKLPDDQRMPKCEVRIQTMDEERSPTGLDGCSRAAGNLHTVVRNIGDGHYSM